MDEKRAVDVVFLDFRKAFDTITRKIFKEKLFKYGLDEHSDVDQKLADWPNPEGPWCNV